MSDKKCQHCKLRVEGCICDAVARFFYGTKHLMKTPNRKRFWYVNPKRISMVWTN